MKKEILDAITNDTIYDYIVNNYTMLSDDELKDILLEYIYAFYKKDRGERYTRQDIKNEINERWCE